MNAWLDTNLDLHKYAVSLAKALVTRPKIKACVH